MAYVQQSLQPSNRWQLGVKVRNTNTGVVLTYVQPGSVAANAGLSVGDRILAIGGHQVGYVDGQLIDPVDEINEHIDPAGQVTMLVDDRQPRPVGRFALPGHFPAAYFKVWPPLMAASAAARKASSTSALLDVTNNWNGVVVGQTSLPRPSANPCYFQLQYNANQIYPGHRYAIAAELIDRGQTIYRTPQVTPVELNAGQIAITLVAAGRDNVTAMPYQQINGWYQTYSAGSRLSKSRAAWADQLNRGQPVSDVQNYLLGSSEYYDRSQNDPDVYLRNVYRALYGTDPTAPTASRPPPAI